MSKTTIKTFTQNSSWTTPAGITSVEVSSVGESYPSMIAATDSAYLINPNGVPYAWGNGTNGRVGDGSGLSRSSPVLVLGTLSLNQVAVGETGSAVLAIKPDGVAYAWGSNTLGQAGFGNAVDQASPVLVLGSLNFNKVFSTGNSSFGLTPSGAAYSWGQNNVGQLADGTITGRSSPVIVVGGLFFKEMIMGNGSSIYALDSAGTPYAWGAGSNGILGDGTITSKSSPVLVLGSLTFKSMTGGGVATFGLTSAGSAYGWGDNSSGTIGDNSSTNRSSPVLVSGGLTFDSVVIANAGSAAYGLTPAGVAYSWGLNNNGQLGDGSTTDRSSPVLVLGGLTFSKLVAVGGGLRAFGLTTSGNIYGWGNNVSGQLGDNSTTNRSSPVLVIGGLIFKDIVSTGNAAAAVFGITTSNQVYAWGTNTAGQLGDGTITNRSSPVLVLGSLTPMINLGKLFSSRFPVVPGQTYPITVGINATFNGATIGLGHRSDKVILVY